MTTEHRLFNPGPAREREPVERMSVGVRRTRRQRALLAAGRHPATGAPLLYVGWGYHCGDCSHAMPMAAGNKSFWKCDQHRLGTSSSEASDIRVGWPACTRFKC